MKKLLLTASLALSAIAAATPAHAVTTFFTNWDSTNFGAGPGFVILPSYEGWTNVSGPGIEVQYNSVAGSPFSGANLVELDSNSNSAMERNILDPGNYTLTYYFSPRPNIAATSNGIDVFINGILQQSVTGVGASNTVWTQYTLNFGLNAPGTVRFAATGNSDSLGGYLEDIRLVGTAVPEPATWLMMLAGFGLIGAGLRRSKKNDLRVRYS